MKECKILYKNFEENFSTHPVYLFQAKFPPTPFIPSTPFIHFEQNFHPPRLFEPPRLFRTREYSACGPITKSKERIYQFKETGNSRYIYQNDLDKACFQHDMPFGDFKNEIISSKQLAEELHEPIITKFEKRKVHSSVTDNISGPNLADMQLKNKFNKGFRFLLCVLDIYSKYAWIISLKR